MSSNESFLNQEKTCSVVDGTCRCFTSKIKKHKEKLVKYNGQNKATFEK